MMNKTILCIAISTATLLTATSAFAELQTKAKLDFDPGLAGGNYGFILSGSYFGMDSNSDGTISKAERTGISQNDGLFLSTAQAASGSHLGAPGCTNDGGVTCDNTGEFPGIDAPWGFFGNTGMHQTTSAATVLTAAGNNATIDFSGWSVTWNGIADIPMGGGAHSGGTDGIAVVSCSGGTGNCEAGADFVLDYFATVPPGDPSNFGGVAYTIHLEGTIGADQNLAPVATTDPLVTSLPPNASVIIDLAANVSDPDGDGVDNTSFQITYTGSRTPAPTIADDGSGMITYTDNEGTDTVTADTFTYTVADTLGKVSAVFNVEVSVASGNLPPIASPFSVNTNKDTAGLADVVANTIDNDGTVDATTVETSNLVNLISAIANGTTGIVTFTPANGFTGTASFDYRVMDNLGDFSNFATVTVNVNAPPIAVDDTANVARNASVGIDVTANDTDADGSIDVTTVIATDGTNGTTSVDALGIVTYTPTTVSITTDIFTYTVKDDKGLISNTATVTVSIVNALPLAVNDTAAINVGTDTSVTIDVTANDTDSDGTIDVATVVPTDGSNGGTTSVDALGIITYTPAGGFIGSDTFTYTVNDNDGATSNVASVIVTVSDSGAAVLPVDATLTIQPATITGATVNITPADGEGSWFNMEVNPGILTHVSLQGFNHLQLGTIQLGSEAVPNIDNPWQFFGNQGVHQTTSAATVLSDDGQGNVTLGLSGWDVSWNQIASIPMSGGAHTAGFIDGVAIMTCANDCAVGDSYKLEYSATVPPGDPSGFGNVKYFLHLEGIVSEGVPSLGGGDVNAPFDVTEIVANDENGTELPVLPGTTADSVGNTSGINLTPADIGLKDPKLNESDGQQCIGGCVDFVVTGVTTSYVDVVIKLNDVMPAGTIYRKLMNGAWVDFDESQGDQIGSATSTSDACQGPEGVFDNGLRAGNDCLYMRIFDNGPNDADSTTGSIADPSGVLLTGSPNTPAGFTDGCSISSKNVNLTERADWLVIFGFIAWLGLLVYRRRTAAN